MQGNRDPRIQIGPKDIVSSTQALFNGCVAQIFTYNILSAAVLQYHLL